MMTYVKPETTASQPPSSPAELQQPSDMIRMNEVIRMVGMSKSTIYSYINDGEFPKPIKLGTRAVAWQRGTIDIWVINRVKFS